MFASKSSCTILLTTSCSFKDNRYGPLQTGLSEVKSIFIDILQLPTSPNLLLEKESLNSKIKLVISVSKLSSKDCINGSYCINMCARK
jgi:hypothetical protein